MIVRLLRRLGLWRRPAIVRQKDTGRTRSPWSGEWFRVTVEPDPGGAKMIVSLHAHEHPDLADADMGRRDELVRPDTEAVWDEIMRMLRWGDGIVKRVRLAKEFGWRPGMGEDE